MSENDIYLIPRRLYCKKCRGELSVLSLYCEHCNVQWSMKDYAAFFGMIKDVKP